MLRRPSPKRKTPPLARPLTLPAPTGGLNARDSLAAMPANDAVILDNFFPGTTSVDLRNGYEIWSSGYPAAVESLMTYNSSTGSKLFAASGTAFYDATSKGAVGAPVVTGNVNARWQHANMGTPGGQFLICVNGADYPQLYNGTAWAQITNASTISITGVDPRKLVHVNMYATRLFFIEKDSTRFWYMPVNSVGGAAASFDLGPLLLLGGYLMAMATWTIDSDAGITEYAVFISSEGEVVIYSGTDPSSAAAWTKNGRFRMGRPVGRRCYERSGSDLIMLTEDGFVPLSKALLTDRSQEQATISDKIESIVSGDVHSYGAAFGWQPALHPVGKKLIVNVPQVENKVQYQYVMNTITGAWCRFTGWNANVFGLMGNNLFFGSNLGKLANSAFVARCDVGYSDNGGFIFGEAKTAFQYFGMPGTQKQVTLARPLLRTSGDTQVAMSIDMDFRDNLPTSMPSFSGSTGTLWNTAKWGTFPWASGSGIQEAWQGATGVGDAAAFHMRTVNNKTSLQWQAVQYVFRTGGIL